METLRLRVYAAMLLTVTFASVAAPGAAQPARQVEGREVEKLVPTKLPTPVKAGTLANKLLLPLYIVDSVNTTTGPTTFYAIRNESTSSVDVAVKYYEPDTANVRSSCGGGGVEGS